MLPGAKKRELLSSDSPDPPSASPPATCEPAVRSRQELNRRQPERFRETQKDGARPRPSPRSTPPSLPAHAGVTRRRAEPRDVQ